MRRKRDHGWRGQHTLWVLALLLTLGWAQPGWAGATAKAELPPLPAVFKKISPTSIEELKEIQSRVQQVVKKVMPAVVNVRVGAGQGSGVIIGDEGIILTAGHVSGAPGQKVAITLADGRNLKGVTLGANRIVDSGLIKITDKGTWPVAEVGESAVLQKGDWCLAIGHPGGIVKGRDPVVRLGRVLDNLKDVIRTDCTLVGGDSGGPLFDMDGKVIGIHSRIMFFTHQNYHVPAKVYQDDWTRLVKGDVIYPAYLGVKRDPDERVCKILEVYKDSAADKAGIKANDVITKFGGKNIASFDDLANVINGLRSGDEVTLDVQRGDATLTLNAVMGAFKK
jgi:serine protease Do